jgi:hypothetical protein
MVIAEKTSNLTYYYYHNHDFQAMRWRIWTELLWLRIGTNERSELGWRIWTELLWLRIGTNERSERGDQLQDSTQKFEFYEQFHGVSDRQGIHLY